jgi:hypothetical protein
MAELRRIFFFILRLMIMICADMGIFDKVYRGMEDGGIGNLCSHPVPGRPKLISAYTEMH